MRVLMINSVCGIRSTGRICTDLAQTLEAQGHEVKIAYGRESVPAQYRRFAVRIGNETGVKLHAAKARLLDASGFGSRFATQRFLKWVRAYDPDVIHLHNIHGYYIHVGLLFDYLRTCGKRIIWTLHDCWAFTGHAAYCEAANCDRWKTGCHHCLKLWDYPKSLTDGSQRNWKQKCYCFTGIPKMILVTPSQWLADLTRSSLLADYPVHVIHNGINTDIFHPVDTTRLRTELNLGTRRVVLGVAALWEKRKGFEDILKISQRMDADFRIVLIGLSRRQRKALPKEIIGVPRISTPQELAVWYSLADVYVNPTYEDNYPTTNLEAISCGTPVVSYDTGGSGESAKLYGCVVEQGNLMMLTNAIQKMANNQHTNRNLLSFIDQHKTTEKYLTLYVESEGEGYK